MCSYRKEFLANDADYNAVTVVMHNYGTDVPGAMQWISDLHDDIVEHFLQLREQVIECQGFPSFGPEVDDQLARYIDGLGRYQFDPVNSIPSNMSSSQPFCYRSVDSWSRRVELWLWSVLWQQGTRNTAITKGFTPSVMLCKPVNLDNNHLTHPRSVRPIW